MNCHIQNEHSAIKYQFGYNTIPLVIANTPCTLLQYKEGVVTEHVPTKIR